MKKQVSLLFVVLSLFFNCSSSSIKNPTDIIPESSIESAITYLASDALQGRATGSKGIKMAADYIIDIFQTHNVKPYFKTYKDAFRINKLEGNNIVGVVAGNHPELKKEYVLLGAHYDHIGNARGVDGDTIANGANDNASGVAAVLEWAKYFAKTNSNKRSVLFVLFDAEESGLKGSMHLANRLKAENFNLYAALCVEMIGVPRAPEHEMAYLTGFEYSNMASVLNANQSKTLVGFLPEAQALKLFFRSDNLPFYNLFKVPAHSISTFDFTNFNYYHHVDDEADKIDYKHMNDFILNMIPSLTNLLNSNKNEVQLNHE